jgi:hypothetical protein
VAPLTERRSSARLRWTLAARNRRDFAALVPGLLLVCVAGGLVAGFFLNLYRVEHLSMPVGYDIARYLDQTALVSAKGLSGAADVVLPPPSNPLTSRVAFPVLALSISRLFGASTFKLAAALPPAAIAAIALAAGSLVSYSLRGGPQHLAAVALIVGTSTVMVRLLVPEAYVDNLFAGALFLAALIPLSSYLRGGRGFLAASLLLGAAGLAHPSFFSFTLLILALTGLFFLPASWRAWRREGIAFISTHVGRLAAVVCGAVLLLIVMVYVILGTGADVPWFSRGVFSDKLQADLHLYRFPIIVPIAALGAAALVAEVLRSRRKRVAGTGAGHGPPVEPDGDGARSPAGPPRAVGDKGSPAVEFLLIVVLGWVAATVAGYLVFRFGRPVPFHRLLAFLVPLPLLAAVAVLAVARVAAARAGVVFGVALALGGIVGIGSIGYHNLYRDIPRTRGVQSVSPEKVQDGATANQYLDRMRVADSQPVVFVVTDLGKDPRSGIPLAAYVLRTVLSPERVERAYLYVGEPQNYLAGRPTLETNDTRHFNEISARYWTAVQPVRQQQPVALLLSAYNPAFDEIAAQHPDWIAAPGVIVLEGPRPVTPLPRAPAPSAPLGGWQLAIFGAGVLVVLGVAGLGWAVAILPPDVRPFEVLALAAACGIAFLVLGGTLMDAAGVRVGGVGGLVAVPLVAAVGWLLAVWRLTRRPPGGGDPMRGGEPRAKKMLATA